MKGKKRTVWSCCLGGAKVEVRSSPTGSREHFDGEAYMGCFYDEFCAFYGVCTLGNGIINCEEWRLLLVCVVNGGICIGGFITGLKFQH